MPAGQDALATVKPQDRAAEDTSMWLLLSATTVFFVLAAVLLGLLLYTQGFLRGGSGVGAARSWLRPRRCCS